jgi:acyl-[acyl-carrier-protein]-phospholipid O-acyltransferase/long-chain-fatty-acid--[acyl-carrier-protein] ligase
MGALGEHCAECAGEFLQPVSIRRAPFDQRARAAKAAVMRLLRALLAAAVRLLFRVRLQGLQHYPANAERVLIVANHTSLLDGVMLYLFLPVVPTFAVNIEMARRWYIKPFLWLVDYRELDTLNPVALKSIVRLVRNGHTTVIFPEGRISTTGTTMKVYDGPGMIADKADATIVPVALEGLQYSRLSYLKGLHKQRWFPRVTLTILPARKLALDNLPAGAARRAATTENLATIMRDIAFANAFVRESMFSALIRASRVHGRRRIILEDSTGARLSYHDLITRSFVLGSLIARLTGHADRVGIMLPSTAAAAVTLFACQARSREAAMLNFTAGARGLVTAIETAAIKIVFTSRAFVEAGGLQAEAAAVAENAQLIYLEDLRDGISLLNKLGGLLAAAMPQLAHRLLSPARSPDDAAVILFTSGSEGIPKGVVLSHANLLANYAQVYTLIDIARRDRVLNVLPLFHAFGLLGGLLLPLFKGTPTYQYPSPLHYRVIPELCYELGITCLFGTTTFLRGYARSANPYDFHRMRFVISGAEKMTEETQQLWNDKFGIRIFEGYGATEVSPVLAVNNPLANRRGSVGQMLAQMDHYIAPVEGIADGGELVVRGPNIMLGYLFHGGDGEIMQPWTEARGAGWYATGDIVALDEQGYIRILGRAKRFAKIAGEMISLAAVEELAHSRWPDGEHAALALSDSRKGEQVVLVTNVSEAARSDLVVAARSAGVNELMIPRRMIFLERLPLLGSGKIDHTALREQVLGSES